ncbi:porin [Paraburkholderia caballeronis]|uniref:Outer membrane protein (Porin) n=1 Tax=Paraburkholderia caballeronis TaxID=416943 RepID=A0A1H7EZ43_9BURK|nr:porin [Paraburkholderia caballeronis]PXW14575.1 putative porin [Paraburkholderia caballeronis]PXW93320.1 putative porin [Paraburkholderia caballeronis]RAJ87224.1 putative porin [Paraburkholderia caballeronis]TDV04993.1 putative porin [Paraburkholderia caballeronis]TDV08161.1 putative porin [Paraburkholderia caballeronis]
MKLKKTTAAVLALGAFAGVAHAQSSVTLYGVADAGLLYTNNVKGDHVYQLSTANSSRWGLRGSEDLGGGLSAIFTLENGYTIGTGGMSQGGLLFGRKAFVGLSSKTYGTLTAGRQYSASNDANSIFGSGADWAASGLGYGTRAADVDNVDTSNRIQNSLKYTSPTWRGLTVGLLYSFGGQAGQFSKNSVWDVAASYANGPFKFGVGYMYTKDPYYATFGNQGNSSTPTSAPGGTNNMPSRIFGGYASAGAQQILTAGGSYALGPATIAVLYSNTQFKDLGSVNPVGSPYATKYTGGTATFNSGELNVKYAFTPALTLAGAYIYTHNSGAGDFGSAHYNQVNLGVIYALSVRTSLYATGFYESASGVDSTGQAAVANLSGSTWSSTSHQVAAIVGMTHRF